MRFSPVVSVFCGVLLSACNLLPTDCTLIGCDDGLAVKLNGQPAGAFRVEVAVPGQDPVVLDCDDATHCPTLFFPGIQAAQVIVRVTTGAGTVTRELSPRYEPVYPNGRRCGPACSQAEVTLDLPG